METNGIPRIDRIQPSAGIPGGDVTIYGSGFVPRPNSRPCVRFGEAEAALSTERLATLDELPDDSSPETWAAHTAFHFALYDAADSRWLLRLIEPLWETSQRYRLAANVAPKLRTRSVEHEVILQACIEHDAELAARSLYNHLTRTANVVSQAMGGTTLFEPLRKG